MTKIGADNNEIKVENDGEELSMEKEQVVRKARCIDKPLVRPTDKEKTNYQYQA